jgi:hypothetical protein
VSATLCLIDGNNRNDRSASLDGSDRVLGKAG